MADLFIGPDMKILGFRMTTPEYAILERALATEGPSRLTALVASYLQDWQQCQKEQACTEIKAFAERATDAERESLLNLLHPPAPAEPMQMKVRKAKKVMIRRPVTRRPKKPARRRA